MKSAREEHACDLQTKFKDPSATATMFCNTQLCDEEGPSHGTPREHGKTENLPSSQTCFPEKRRRRTTKSIQDRFLRCLIYRQSQLDIGWTEEHCARLEEIAAEDHSYVATAAERTRRENTWVLVLNSSGPKKDLATQWIQSYPCKTKRSQETQRSLQKFLEPTRKHKVIYTANSQEFGKSCEDLSWNHCTSTPYRSETNGVAERESGAQNQGRDFCRTDAVRSG